MGKVKIAVIGLNFGNKHARSILNLRKEADLCAVCDLDDRYSSEFEKDGVPFFADFRKMIADTSPDGVIVAVPPTVHEEIGVYCLERGITCLVEKPIAVSAEAADRLIDAASRHGARLVVGHHHRFDPGVQKVKERIESGELGKLVGFHLFGTYPKVDEYFADPWRRKRSSGGGPIISNAAHDIDRLRYVCGDIKSVFAKTSSAYRGYEVEDTAGIVMECEDGIVGTFYISDASHTVEEATDYYFCSKATITVNSSSFQATEFRHLVTETAWSFNGRKIGDRTFSTRQTRLPRQDNHLEEIRHFCRVVEGKEEPRSSGEDAKKSLVALLAIIESAHKRAPVEI